MRFLCLTLIQHITAIRHPAYKPDRYEDGQNHAACMPDPKGAKARYGPLSVLMFLVYRSRHNGGAWGNNSFFQEKTK